MTRLGDSNQRSRLTADELNAALAQEWCNGCGKPRALWGPVCGGMTQGDFTHYHSPAWWRQRFLAESNWCKRWQAWSRVSVRTFRIDPPLDDDADRTYFSPVGFVVVGEPPCGDFLLEPKEWVRLGRPKTITVTVEAAFVTGLPESNWCKR